LNLSHYGVLYSWNNNQPTPGQLRAGISLSAGVPGPTFGQYISDTNIQFAPSSLTVPQPSVYYNIYEWMSNQTLDTATQGYNITGNMMVNGHLYQMTQSDEFANANGSTWGYQFGAEALNTSTYKLPYFILTNAVQEMPTFTIGSSSAFSANFSTITQVPYETINAYNGNLSQNEVTYQISAGSFSVIQVYYNASWTFFSATFSATASPINNVPNHFVLLDGVDLNPVYITFIQPPITKPVTTISVAQVQGLTTLKPDNSTRYSFSLRLAGTPLSSDYMNATAQSSSFEIFNAQTGFFISQGFVSVNGSTLQESFTTVSAGDYYYVLSSSPTINGKTYTLQYGGTFNVSQSVNISHGLGINILGPPSIVQNTPSQYRIIERYANNSLLSGNDTNSTIKNMTIQIGSIYEKPFYLSNGIVNFTVNISTPGNYFINAGVTPTLLGNAKGYAQNEISFNVTNKPIRVNNNMLLSLNAPSGTLIANVPYHYSASVSYVNNSAMNASDTQQTAKNMNITVFNFNTKIAYGSAIYLSSGVIGFNLSLPAGNYFIVVTVNPEMIGGLNVSSKESMAVNIVSQTGVGMSIHISTPTGGAQTGQPFVSYISITILNGTQLSFSQTQGIANHLVVDVYSPASIYLISPLLTVQSPGKILFSLNFSKIGEYTISVSFNGTINGRHASAAASDQVLLTSYQPGTSAWQQILSGFSNIFVQVTIGIIVTLMIYFGGKALVGRRTERKQMDNATVATVRGNLITDDIRKNGEPITIKKRDMKRIEKELKDGD
jgi:hypothetical protein